MADQEQCPECLGRGEATPDDFWIHHPMPCQVCGGSGRKSTQEELRDPAGTQDRLPDEVLRQAARLMEKANCSPDPCDDWYVLLASAAAPVLVEHGRQQERGRIKRDVQQVLSGGHGLITTGPPMEWGPQCAGCGDDEYRIDGFCSIECRDRSEMAFDVLAALDRGDWQ